MSQKCRVVNLRKEPYDIYIGRPSKWGNPFVLGVDGDRAAVVQAFRQYITQRPSLMASVSDLRGKVLGCYCHPLPCHGDVLAELANEL